MEFDASLIGEFLIAAGGAPEAVAGLWFEADGLLSQGLAEPPNFAAIWLPFDTSQAIFGHIQAEWRQSRGSRAR